MPEIGKKNKQLLRSLYEGVVAGKQSDLSDLFSENFIVYKPAIAPCVGVYKGFSGQADLGKAQTPYINAKELELLELYADSETVESKVLVEIKNRVPKLMLSEHVTYENGKVIECVYLSLMHKKLQLSIYWQFKSRIIRVLFKGNSLSFS